jgi:hypothetical protein
MGETTMNTTNVAGMHECINRLERSRLVLKRYILARLALDRCTSDEKRPGLIIAVARAEHRLVEIGDWPEPRKAVRKQREAVGDMN